ncbi:conserved hypothetical protein [Myxococcus xanthus DK 1622]|uniref:Uncharacterized protein n=1 Tax=Myxococcus xanthus (strain DK1622) TaxID=246197 RepID=Q1CXN3_MYXXD|nr:MULTISPECIES: hypothetical protein [Myxococcus]ABF92377.1 conserved hypothetical protein [Myxococcus xanthus DK 1622]NOJ51410.1 transcriptional regulator [Myxococcus xanthus]QPM79031.1 transcriptional regulator [Myxococcus xanthus]QVW68109.1 transcriptional regulator [Myxococcus xanthus DZ2]QZZ54337.1 hypothetical protein MyxoNM_34430 [Myxococcus xanthus]
MARGSKAKYTAKQKRMAEHIEEGYEKRGVSDETAESRAWATVNKLTGGGMKKGGSGGKAKVARSRPLARKNARKAGRKGGKATAAKRAGTRRRAATGRTRKPAARAMRSGSKSTAARGTSARRATARRTSTAKRPASKSRSGTRRGTSSRGSRGRTRT